MRRRFVERRPNLAMAHHARETRVGEKLVGADRERPESRLAKEAHDAGEIGHREEEDVEVLRDARELERRFGDDAERPLAADEKLPEIDAGIVLLERAVQLEHFAARKHHLEAEHPLPREAIANDLHPAGVRRDVATDVARPFRREVDGPREAVRRAVLVYRFGDGARLDTHRRAEQIDGTHATHAREREDDLAVRSHRPPREPRATARRDDRDCELAAEGEETRNFVCRSRQGDDRRRGLVDLRPVFSVLGEVGGVTQREVGRKIASEAVEEGAGEGSRA